MFKEGNILYFNPFYFENGNTPKPKYFLVLKEVDGQLVLASLPTLHDHMNKFKSLISEGKSEVTYKGKMMEEEYRQLMDCLIKSSSVKRVFRRLL